MYHQNSGLFNWVIAISFIAETFYQDYQTVIYCRCKVFYF